MRPIARVAFLLVGCAGCVHEMPTSASPAVGEEPQQPQASLTESDKDSVRGQIEDHFMFDPGLAGFENFVVEIQVIVNPDGSVQSAKIDPTSYNGHPNWSIFAQNCLRAVQKSSPLVMPSNRPYDAWRTITLVFSARDMAGM